MKLQQEQTAKKALIWDLDGTLLNSYPVILDSLQQAYREIGFETDREDLYAFAIHYSLGDYAQKQEKEKGIPSEPILKRYAELSQTRAMEIPVFSEARQTLDALREMGIANHVFTHRGKTTLPVLQNIGLLDCFGEIITSQEPFRRKPAPDALLYLIEKHALSKENTFYVGDRTLDMDCAKNAGIRGILFLPEGSYCQPNGSESYIVKRLLDIPSLPAICE